MKISPLFVFFVFASVFLLYEGCNLPANPKKEMENVMPEQRLEYALAVHGGAGTILKENMSPEKEDAYMQALDSALNIGKTMLEEGKAALDVVEAVIVFMEDNDLFNAGKGAVFTHEGKNELDASIMDGKTHNAGAVGAVTKVKNPIRAARAVMEKSKHVMLFGPGAEEFAIEQGLDTVSPEYFKTEFRKKALDDAKDEEKKTGDIILPGENYKFGTVGCVVLDKNGNLAAGTSTGGMTNKRWNRIGDSPIIGAGTYADNGTCAVSCTGHGEYFIRYTVAKDIAARMEYLGESVSEAAGFVIHNKLKDAGGSGGVIAVDKSGNIAMPFNTAGMYRGFVTPGKKEVHIYKEE